MKNKVYGETDLKIMDEDKKEITATKPRAILLLV